MKIARLVLCAVLLLPLGTATAAHAEYGRARVGVNVSVFYDSLAPYGTWYSTPRFGLVWAPRVPGPSWRPYTDGRWVYTDYGWTWDSDLDWGWAAFHYGRWYLDPELGWVWVPGSEWAPAWVDFCEGDGWVGWAPLGPGLSFGASFTFRDPARFVFVAERNFLDRDLARRVEPFRRNGYLLAHSARATRYQHVRGALVNRSVSVERIARATRHRPETYRVIDSGARGRSRAARGHDIAMYRPRITTQRPSHRPAVVHQAPRRAAPARPPARRERRAAPARPPQRTVTVRPRTPAARPARPRPEPHVSARSNARVNVRSRANARVRERVVAPAPRRYSAPARVTPRHVAPQRVTRPTAPRQAPSRAPRGQRSKAHSQQDRHQPRHHHGG
jgi:Family of unknown function (DUF6600)